MTLFSKLVVILFLLNPLILLPLFFNNNFVSSSPHKNIPRLSPYYRESLILRDHDHQFLSTNSEIPQDFKTYFYNQTLDHFNYQPQSYATFQQRYVVDSTHWGGANLKSPIFAYFGAEAPLDGDLKYIGFLRDNAPTFKALSVYIEHRFYGKSIPFGTMNDVMKNDTLRGYFNSAQAIADYAEILLHVKNEFCAEDSPIIVIGGSYGGMLASWFRLKYPHIALGALASSAPILYFDNITPNNGYYSLVTKDFKEVSENCYQTIRDSWAEIDKVASEPNGLSLLSQRFNTCAKLNDSSELSSYLDGMYVSAAQYNSPPNYPVTMICQGIDGVSENNNNTDILGRIFGGLVSYRGNKTCYDTHSYPSETSVGWLWQTCSELVIPIGRGENDTMFPASPFSLNRYISYCEGIFGIGIQPRPHWITTYYGGHDIKLVLNRFGSNIIFSNGLKDPYSSGGVLEDLSESVLAVTTTNGSHCLDILNSAKTDPEWLVKQRNVEVEIIQGWFTKYYDDLKAFEK